VGTIAIMGLGVRVGKGEFSITDSRSLVGATVIMGVDGVAQAVSNNKNKT
jgi:hypothetical protein